MTAACANCGAPLAGEYCAACGQQRIHPGRETLAGFIRSALAALSPGDGRALRSLGVLVTRPGVLTRAYIDGRRRHYLPPLQLFLLANLLFFVIGGVIGNTMFTQSLYSHENMQLWSSMARDMVRAKMTAVNAPDYNQLVDRFELITEHYARALVAIMIPLIALAVAALQFRRGRALHHVVFALHYLAFALLLYLGLYGAFWLIALTGWAPTDTVFALAAFTLQTLYLAVAFSRAYDERIALAVVKGALTSVAALMVVQLYRFILFLVAINAA